MTQGVKHRQSPADRCPHANASGPQSALVRHAAPQLPVPNPSIAHWPGMPGWHVNSDGQSASPPQAELHS